MPTYSRIAVVTGGNKGIGLACVRQLALQYPASSFNNGPLLIYLTARNKERGEKALRDILDDPPLRKAKALRTDGGIADIKYSSLDIDDSDSIKDFADLLKKEHPGGIDFVINNAGIALDGFNADIVRKTIRCNYHGTMEATKQLLPQIRDGGRLVNVASEAGLLNSKYSAPTIQRFLNAKTTDEVTSLMDEFTTAVEKDSYEGKWPGAAYRVSKAGVIGMTRVVARLNAESGSKVLINSCCPGYVDTDMSKHNGVKTPDQGARTPVLLALGDVQDSNGQFWKDENVSSWEVGK